MTTNSNLFEILKKWLIKLPTDLKMLTEMVRDEQLNKIARTMAVGAVIYVLAPIDIIPDRIPIIGNIDDVIVLHIALSIIIVADPDRSAYYREKYPEQLKALPEQLELLRETLGAIYDWLYAMVEKLPNRRYQGKSTEEVIQSKDLQEEIFDESMEYAANVNVDPKAIEDALLTIPPTRILEKLSDGVEEEQKRQIEDISQEEKPGFTQRLVSAAISFRKQLGIADDE